MTERDQSYRRPVRPVLPERWQVSDGLSDRERVLVGRFLGLYSDRRERLEEIGDDIGMTKAGVGKIVRQAMMKMALIYEHDHPREASPADPRNDR